MSLDIERSLGQLDKKQLHKLARSKNINIPKEWSRTLIVELLALNVSKKDLQTIDQLSLEVRTRPKDGSAIIIKDLVVQFEEVSFDNPVIVHSMEVYNFIWPTVETNRITMINEANFLYTEYIIYERELVNVYNLKNNKNFAAILNKRGLDNIKG